MLSRTDRRSAPARLKLREVPAKFRGRPEEGGWLRGRLWVASYRSEEGGARELLGAFTYRFRSEARAGASLAGRLPLATDNDNDNTLATGH